MRLLLNPRNTRDMMRSKLIISLTAALFACAILIMVLCPEAPEAGGSVELEVLPPLIATPFSVTADIPTFVTFTADLRDQAVKKPLLQFYETGRGRWKNLKALQDRGVLEDDTANDLLYNARIRILSDGETVTIGIPSKNGSVKKELGPFQAPLRLRVVGKSKQTKGLLTSAEYVVQTDSSTAMIFPGSQDKGAAYVDVPTTFELIGDEVHSPTLLRKRGPEGYDVLLKVLENQAALPLEDFIVTCVFNPANTPCQKTDSGQPHSLEEYKAFGVVFDYEQTALVGLEGRKLTYHDPEGGTSIAFFIADPDNKRVFQFEIQPANSNQVANFQSNLDEAINIVNSFRM